MSNLLASVGLMFIIKYGSILEPYRRNISKIHPKIKELHKCSLCLGFWTGLIISVIDYMFITNKPDILLPLMSSGVCWFIDNLNNLIQSLEIKIDKDLDLK